jgi:NAD(P)-dependent dehydrogenase (short-subunit alcohol dehydrogenase family)
MCAAPDIADEAIVDQMVAAAVTELGSLDLLVVDGAGLFAQGGLRTCFDATWNVTRAVVNLAFLAAELSSSSRPEPGSPTCRIIYLAPAPNACEHSGAARAGLENLARTLSTEWARHGITVVTIAPGEETAAGEVAALCAYLASPAGAYFSGCLLDLRGP